MPIGGESEGPPRILSCLVGISDNQRQKYCSWFNVPQRLGVAFGGRTLWFANRRRLRKNFYSLRLDIAITGCSITEGNCQYRRVEG